MTPMARPLGDPTRILIITGREPRRRYDLLTDPTYPGLPKPRTDEVLMIGVPVSSGRRQSARLERVGVDKHNVMSGPTGFTPAPARGLGVGVIGSRPAYLVI